MKTQTEQLTLRIPKELLAKLTKLAKQEHKARSLLVRSILEKAVKHVGILALVAVMVLVGTSAHALSAKDQKEDCAQYITYEDAHSRTAIWPDNPDQSMHWALCLGYFAGVRDEMQAEIFGYPEGDNELARGQWVSGSVSQYIRVFVKYIDANPEVLDKDAAWVFRKAVEKAGLYTETPIKHSLVPTGN